jgi:hypothetical protein
VYQKSPPKTLPSRPERNASGDAWVGHASRRPTGARGTCFRKFQAEIFPETGAYIRELRQSGFDTVRLEVQLQKKFSVPLFALIMALISTSALARSDPGLLAKSDPPLAPDTGR